MVAGFVNGGLDVDAALDRLTTYNPGGDGRIITSKEACAALVTAQALGWLHWSS
ncbi:MAG: hypothetical protein QM756_03535 [Polyangiaceae bacterium]